MTRRLPVSGSEPLYSDLIYGTPEGQYNNNCYAWAIGNYRGSGGIKLQPGNLSKASTEHNATSCAFLKKRAMQDNHKRGVVAVKPTQRCPKGFYKIMAFIDKGRDYHWYKQHRNLLYRVAAGETIKSIAKDMGVRPSNITSPTPAPRPGDLVFVKNADVFSHKQGFATGPLLRDASKKSIPDPRHANRNYGEYNYRTFCGALCVRTMSLLEGPPNATEARALNSLLHKRMKMMK